MAEILRSGKFLSLIILSFLAGFMLLPAEPAFSAFDGIVIHSSDCSDVKSTGKNSTGAYPGCHYLITRAGGIRPVNPENKPVRHMDHYLNNRSLSIAIEGDYNNWNIFARCSPMSRAQKNALTNLLFNLMQKYNIPLSQIERHMDHEKTSFCPGNDFEYFDLLYDMAKKMIKENGRPLLEDICRNKKIKLPISNAKLVIDKTDYKLYLYSGNMLLKSYNIGLSNKPKGDKLLKGDRKTPVGEFYICEKYPMRAWMEFSFPDEKHANAALKKNLITTSQHNAIITAEKAGGLPYHESVMGNDVGLHAGGFPYGKMRKDYTAGCIGLEDPEAYEIYSAVPLGAKIIIKE